MLRGHQGNLSSKSFGFLEDYKILATGSRDNTLRFWNLNSSKCLKKFLTKDKCPINLLRIPFTVNLSYTLNNIVETINLLDSKIIKRFEGRGHSSLQLTYYEDQK